MDTDKRKILGVRLICLVFIAVCAVLYYRTFSFPQPIGIFGSDYGSAFFPRIMLGIIGVGSVGILLQTLITGRPAGPSAGLDLGLPQVIKVLAVWLTGLAFFWAWKNFEFLYVSAAFMIVVSLLLGVRRIVSLILLGAVGPLIYFVFQQVLRVSL
ncbi:MAG: tripartite tricarboxylate transporter TctB family protein [Trueperaceae bacterium]